jgi:hypothetical protein
MLSKKSEKKITFKLSEKIPQNEPDWGGERPQ